MIQEQTERPLLTPTPLRSRIKRSRGEVKYVAEECLRSDVFQIYCTFDLAWYDQIDVKRILEYEIPNEIPNCAGLADMLKQQVREGQVDISKYVLENCFRKWMAYVYKNDPVDSTGKLHPDILNDVNSERKLVVDKYSYLINWRRSFTGGTGVTHTHTFLYYYDRWRSKLRQKYGQIEEGDPRLSKFDISESAYPSVLEEKLTNLCKTVNYKESGLPPIEVIVVAPVSQYLENVIPGVSWMYVSLEDLELKSEGNSLRVVIKM
jgi:hypothetical protein